MPSGAVHRFFDKLLFGEDGDDIHKWMDAPAKWLGPNHRKVRHDLDTLFALYLLNGDRGVEHGLSHILIDEYLSQGYNELRKEINKMFAGILKL